MDKLKKYSIHIIVAIIFSGLIGLAIFLGRTDSSNRSSPTSVTNTPIATNTPTIIPISTPTAPTPISPTPVPELHRNCQIFQILVVNKEVEGLVLIGEQLFCAIAISPIVGPDIPTWYFDIQQENFKLQERIEELEKELADWQRG